jgi:hypothetical protein
MTKRSVTACLPWTAIFIVSSTLAYALNSAAVSASMSSSQPVQGIVVSQIADSHAPLEDVELDTPGCLAAWGFVSANRPEIAAAGFQLFVDSWCSAT